MATYYEVPGGMAWCKANLKIIIGNSALEEIMQFGDTWRARGHKPLVHVISPAMDGGKMWDQHEDPSGLLDNVTAHIDMLVVDFYNRYEPELPKIWEGTANNPQWLLWEYKGGFVRFNGDHSAFVRAFGVDPDKTQTTTPPSSGGTTTPPAGGTANEVIIHMVCPHCGKQIY
jgi:hypothetical protein